MIGRWIKQAKKSNSNMKKDLGLNPKRDEGYKIERIRPPRRKKRHPGFTIIPEHSLWMFDKNKEP